MSSREFAEWCEFYRLDPFGSERSDMQAAMMASVTANAWRGKDQDAYTVEHFMLELGERKLRKGPEVAIEGEASLEDIGPERGTAILEMLNRIYGGKDIREQ